MMTNEEIEAFLSKRKRDRDSASFAIEMIAQARDILAHLPEPGYKETA
jgi:hypothetical protein